MRIKAEINGQWYEIDSASGVDISIPMNDRHGPLAWYIERIKIDPVVHGDFIGSVAKGAPVNFMNVYFNPHGNGTHTECVAHISDLPVSINQQFTELLLHAELVTITPKSYSGSDSRFVEGDLVILEDDISLSPAFKGNTIIIRTTPNSLEKLNHVYSGTNPIYCHPDAITKLLNAGIEHILIDLPSIDREEDNGALLSHKRFWNYPENPNTDRTITELIYVPDTIADGEYLVNIQVAPFIMDASPSRVMIYKV